MEKVIQTRVKKVHSGKDASGEAQKAAEIFNTRYFEMKRSFDDVEINYHQLLIRQAVMTKLQEIHQKAVRDGKIFLAERAILTAEKEAPKIGMHLKRTGKSLDTYDALYKRMNDAYQLFVVIENKSEPT